MAYIISGWNSCSEFPVNFHFMEGFNESTDQVVKALNQLTPQVHDLFLYLHARGEGVKESCTQLLCKVGMRGIMVMLGLRKTTGSVDGYTLPKIAILYQGFN